MCIRDRGKIETIGDIQKPPEVYIWRDHNKKLMKKRRGFTLIEIMVVVVIIGLLSALVGLSLIHI